MKKKFVVKASAEARKNRRVCASFVDPNAAGISLLAIDREFQLYMKEVLDLMQNLCKGKGCTPEIADIAEDLYGYPVVTFEAYKDADPDDIVVSVMISPWDGENVFHSLSEDPDAVDDIKDAFVGI